MHRSTIVAFLLLSACGQAAEAPVAAPPSAQVAPEAARAPSEPALWVQVTAPSDRSVLEAPARVLAGTRSIERVALELPLRVVRVHVQGGDAVEQGAPLFDVSSEAVLAASATYLTASEGLRAADARLAVVRGMRDDRLASATDVFELESRALTLRGEQRAALATLAAASLEPRTASGTLARGAFTLRAKQAGIVRDVQAIVGEVHAAGVALCTLVGGESQRVEARIAAPLEEGFRYRFVDLRGRSVELGDRPLRTLDSGTEGGAYAWFEMPADSNFAAEAPGHLIIDPIDERFVQVPVTALAYRGDKVLVLRRRAETTAETEVRVIVTSGASAIVEGDLRREDRVAADAAGALSASSTEEEP